MRGSPGEILEKEEERRGTTSTRAVQENNFFKKKKKNFFKSLPAGGKVSGMVWGWDVGVLVWGWACVSRTLRASGERRLPL